MKTGRNDPCKCGSGKKYKHCHESKEKKQNNQYIIIGIIAIIVIAFISIDSSKSNVSKNVPVSSPLLNQQGRGNSTKPSGPAPVGKVWSQEHGHYHDDPGNTNLNSPRLNTSPSQLAGKPKPEGNPPPGKVWNEEHGHWHDAPISKSLTPKILGENDVNKITVPSSDKDNPTKGKVWNEEHGHFHDKE